MSRINARESAMKLFYQRDLTKSSSYDEMALEEMAVEFKLNDNDRKYIINLLEIAFSKKDEIDRLITKFSKEWKFDRLAKVDLAILRLSVCEMLCIDDVPANVSINEAVELAKKFGDSGSSSFVNGVLGSIYTEIEQKRGSFY